MNKYQQQGTKMSAHPSKYQAYAAAAMTSALAARSNLNESTGRPSFDEVKDPLDFLKDVKSPYNRDSSVVVKFKKAGMGDMGELFTISSDNRGGAFLFDAGKPADVKKLMAALHKAIDAIESEIARAAALSDKSSKEFTARFAAWSDANNSK